MVCPLYSGHPTFNPNAEEFTETVATLPRRVDRPGQERDDDWRHCGPDGRSRRAAEEARPIQAPATEGGLTPLPLALDAGVHQRLRWKWSAIVMAVSAQSVKALTGPADQDRHERQ
jgi:hypothetical protein